MWSKMLSATWFRRQPLTVNRLGIDESKKWRHIFYYIEKLCYKLRLICILVKRFFFTEFGNRNNWAKIWQFDDYNNNQAQPVPIYFHYS